MVCTAVKLPSGEVAIVCGPRRRFKRCACGSGHNATLLCDWKVEGGTCDKSICDVCTTVPAPDKDLCPEHAALWEARQAARRMRAP